MHLLRDDTRLDWRTELHRFRFKCSHIDQLNGGLWVDRVGGGFANDIDAYRRFVSTALARMDCDDSDDQVALSLCRCISVSVFKHKIQLQSKSFVRSYRNSALSAKIS